MKNGSRRAPRVAELERSVLDLERTVQLLEEARSHYADHYDFAPYGCLTLDDRGCVLELNVTAANFLGRERAQIIGMPLLTHVDKPSVPAFLHHLRECRRSREKVVSEVLLRTRAYGPRLVELMSVPVIDTHTGGTVSRTALRDITESRQAERALQQSEERFSTAFRVSPSALGIFTLADQRFIDVNASFCRLIGLPASEIVGRTSLEIGYITDAALREEWIDRARSGRAVRDVETRVRHKSGEFRDALVSAEVVTLGGEKCLLVIGRDITEQKRLQSEVIEIGEREQARIGEDLHDGVCQNLAGITYLADVLARELDARDAASAASVRRISVLVRESIEETRRLAAGLFPVKIERYGLARALRELAAETSDRSKATCRFEMPRPITFTEQSVSLHLYRIAQEAVRNALVHGRARNITLRLDSADGRARLGIRDDGIGMPSREKRKCGLGLHTMSYRARMLGGTLDVASTAGRGTSVTCSIPDCGIAHVHGSTHSQEEEDFPR